VVVDQFDVQGVAVHESKDDAPIGADCDRPESAEISFQCMQSEARQPQFLGGRGHIEQGQDPNNGINQIRPNSPAFTVFIKPIQRATLQIPDHTWILD